jgi:hypothetical protein
MDGLWEKLEALQRGMEDGAGGGFLHGVRLQKRWGFCFLCTPDSCDGQPGPDQLQES